MGWGSKQLFSMHCCRSHGWGALTLSPKHQGRNQCCSDQLLKDHPPNSWTRMLPRMLQFFSSGTQERQFRDPGEPMGPSFSPSLLAGMQLGGDRDRVRWGPALGHGVSSGKGRAVLAQGQPAHRAMPVCSLEELWMNSCTNNNNKNKNKIAGPVFHISLCPSSNPSLKSLCLYYKKQLHFGAAKSSPWCFP